MRGTSAEDNIQVFSKVFSRHSIPKRLHSDNGAPFNGKDSHLLQKYLNNMGIEHVTNKSTKDPEVTGLVEAFMCHLKKIFHTAGVKRVDLYLRINNYLMQFRATLHATMRKSLAELLFGRKFVTKLPDPRTNTARDRKDIMEAKEELCRGGDEEQVLGQARHWGRRRREQDGRYRTTPGARDTMVMETRSRCRTTPWLLDQWPGAG